MLQPADLSLKYPIDFSVVIPVFNRARVVARAIESVLLQTRSSFEIVIVDDGSSDDLSAVVRKFDDERIRLVRQNNQGACAARNHGVDVARGRYVAFLDSDDAFLPHHLETMADLLGASGNLIVYCPVRAQRGKDFMVKPPRAIAVGEAMADYLMCGRGFVQTSGLVVPTAVAREVRYRINVIFGDDTDFAIRLQLAGYDFVMAKEPGVDWFDGPDPLRLSNSSLDIDRMKWLEDLRPEISTEAYKAYRGWHFAKALFPHSPLRALGLYLDALAAGAYSPSLAGVVLLQIIVPRRIYRGASDFLIGLKARRAEKSGIQGRVANSSPRAPQP